MKVKLKAISLWQPYASAIALGLKRYETRAYPTRWAGSIAIHAAQKKSRALRELFYELLEDPEIYSAFRAARMVDYDKLPFGAIVAHGKMDGCAPVKDLNVSDLERMLGDYSRGRFAWRLGNLQPLPEPFPVSGKQGFFFVNIPQRLIG